MRKLVIAVVILCTFILETSLFQFFRVFGIKPDFMLMVIVSYALIRGSAYGASIGFVFGLLVDLFYGQIIGINALAYMVVGYIVGCWTDKIFAESIFTAITFNVLAVIIYEVIFVLCTIFTKTTVNFETLLFFVVIPQLIMNSFLGILIHKLVFYIDEAEFCNKNLF